MAGLSGWKLEGSSLVGVASPVAHPLSQSWSVRDELTAAPTQRLTYPIASMASLVVGADGVKTLA